MVCSMCMEIMTASNVTLLNVISNLWQGCCLELKMFPAVRTHLQGIICVQYIHLVCLSKP